MPRRIPLPRPNKRPSIVDLAYASLERDRRAADKRSRTPPERVKARPGKTTPTKAEREWLDFIVRYGCIACRIDGHDPRPTAVHHIVESGRRLGHLLSIGLCDPGHHQGGRELGMVSRHPNKARFEAKYGTERELLAMLRKAHARELAAGAPKAKARSSRPGPIADSPTQRRAV